MAARRDELDALLSDLRTLSAPRLEARLRALTSFTPDPRIAAAAVALLNDFPFRSREQLGAAAVATGLALLHGVNARSLVATVKVESERTGAWRAAVVPALVKALGTPTKAAPPAALDGFTEGPATKVAERASALIDCTRDARIGDAAAALLHRAPIKATVEHPYFTIAALLLSVHGEPKHRAIVQRFVAQVPALGWLEQTLPTDDAVAPHEAPGAESEASLLRFIAEDPSDDARVAVFTDWLLEHSDPRGEFNALQRGSPESRRIAQLQKKHEKQWLRSLARGALRGTAVFRNGVLREVHISAWKPADLPLSDEPVLATLQSLELDGGSNLPLADVLRSPMLKSLRSLTAKTTLLTTAPATMLNALTSLGVLHERDVSLEVLASCPNVKRLMLREGNWADVKLVTPHLSRLTHLEVETHEPAKWFAVAKQIAELDVWPAWARSSAEGKRRARFHFERGQLTKVDAQTTPDATALELWLFEPLESLHPAQRHGATLDAELPAAATQRFTSLCG